MDDVNRIIARRSAAQKKALMWLPADGSARTRAKGAPSEVSFWAMSNIVEGNPAKEIARMYRLCRHIDGKHQPGRFWPDRMWQLTPLGLAVRQRLQERAE